MVFFAGLEIESIGRSLGFFEHRLSIFYSCLLCGIVKYKSLITEMASMK